MKKLADKVDKCQRDVLTTREKYEASLNDITSYNAKYMEDMTDVRATKCVYKQSNANWRQIYLRFYMLLFSIHMSSTFWCNPPIII